MPRVNLGLNNSINVQTQLYCFTIFNEFMSWNNEPIKQWSKNNTMLIKLWLSSFRNPKNPCKIHHGKCEKQ